MTTATAAAMGQSLLPKNSSHNTRPIISVCGPPSSSGMTNSPTQGMNTSMVPAMIPLLDSGTVMRQKACAGVAPRSSAASKRFRSIFTRVAYSGRIMKGM